MVIIWFPIKTKFSFRFQTNGRRWWCDLVACSPPSSPLIVGLTYRATSAMEFVIRMLMMISFTNGISPLQCGDSRSTTMLWILTGFPAHKLWPDSITNWHNLSRVSYKQHLKNSRLSTNMQWKVFTKFETYYQLKI